MINFNVFKVMDNNLKLSQFTNLPFYSYIVNEINNGDYELIIETKNNNSINYEELIIIALTKNNFTNKDKIICFKIGEFNFDADNLYGRLNNYDGFNCELYSSITNNHYIPILNQFSMEKEMLHAGSIGTYANYINLLNYIVNTDFFSGTSNFKVPINELFNRASKLNTEKNILTALNETKNRKVFIFD